MNTQPISKRRRTLIILGLVLVLMAASSTWAFAQIEGDGTIKACVSTSGGTLRIVSDFSSCKKGEQGLSWNIMGQKGDPGEVGPAGPAGEKGLACWDLNGNGEKDLQEDVNEDKFVDVYDCKGQQGEAGPEGPVGATGPQGLQGERGQQGAAGPAGPQGPKGDIGPAGPGIGSFEQLEGLPCQVGLPGEGLISLTYDQATGYAMIKCIPTNPPETFYTLTIVKSGNGSNSTITSSPAGIFCGTTCSYSFPAGSVIDLFIDPSEGELFETWGGTCSGDTCSLSLNADTIVEANFQPASNTNHSIYVSLDFSQVELPYPIAATGEVWINSDYICSAGQPQPCGPYIYDNGQTITFTALATVNSPNGVPSIFYGWGGICEGETSNICTVTLDSTDPVDLVVELVFTLW